jgi:release factor glutamine methyltransferase
MSGEATRSLYRVAWRVRRAFWRRAETQPTVEMFDGVPIIILPGVFNGVLLRTGAFLAQTLNTIQLLPNARVLDLGTGSGVGALFAARRGARVIASDINPEAARCAQINALAQHLEHKIETRVGDLFESVRGEQFDLILFNPPYYRGQPRDMADYAWRSPDAFERFLRELPPHLTENGRALVVLSSDNDVADALAAQHLRVRVIAERNLLNETLTIYEIRAA